MGLVVIYAQTFPSMTSQSEVLVRLLLWLWVAINTAILVTLLVNACFLQAFPGYQFKSRLALMFREAGSLLVGNHADTKRPTLKILPISLPNCNHCINRQTVLVLTLRQGRRHGNR